MKKLFLSLILVQIFAGSFQQKTFATGGNNVNFYIHGHVSDAITGAPVAGQPVSINSDIIHYSDIKLTNQIGIYQDTIFNVPLGIPVIISVFDCNDSLHSQTVHSSGSSVEVNFSICTLPPCLANFTSRLDSNNSVQNTFIFTDLSEGHPNHWAWTFGDGEVSHDQNPVHSYRNPGQYHVCLSITKKSITGEILCSDSLCKEISTQSYYNLGGLVFAGLYPINNPSSTGDTGIAYLYRMQKGKIVPIDTISFTYLGYYAFLRLLEGDYMIKVGLKKGSAHYTNFLPEYSGDQLKWQASSPVKIDGASSFSNNIHLLQTATSEPGIGAIGGYVSHRERGPLMKDAEVILYNANSEPIGFTVSDASGKFDFRELEYGKYYLYPEIAGKYALLQEVLIEEAAPVIDGIVLEVSDQEFTGIGSWNNDNCIIRVYPNPFSSELNIQVVSELSGKISVDLVNLTGMKFCSDSYNCDGNPLNLTISLQDIPKGLYFLTLRSSEGAIISTRKVIKK